MLRSLLALVAVLGLVFSSVSFAEDKKACEEGQDPAKDNCEAAAH